jgi:hypothetical protein
LELVSTSARRMGTRWRRPAITRGTPTGNQPIRVSASEPGVCEADVRG